MLLRERLGQGCTSGCCVVGTNLTFLPSSSLGQDGMTRRIADYPARAGWGTLNALVDGRAPSSIALGVLVFLVNVALSLRAAAARRRPTRGTAARRSSGRRARRRRGTTSTALPPVRSYAPLWDLRQAAAREVRAEGPGAPAGNAEALA